MSKEQRQRALARIEGKPSGGSLTDDPITIGLDKSIRIDTSKLPAPQNIYDADVAWAEHRPGAVSLMFGKLNRDVQGSLRTRLEVRYPAENLVRHFWGNSRKFHERLKEFADKWPHDSSAPLSGEKMSAVKDHSEWANFDAMAHAGTEASIDFYKIPASGVAKFAAGQGSEGLQCQPVVRVQLTIFALLRFLDHVGAAVAQIEKYLPEPVKSEA